MNDIYRSLALIYDSVYFFSVDTFPIVVHSIKQNKGAEVQEYQISSGPPFRGSCSCPGFKFTGGCKHVSMLEGKYVSKEPIKPSVAKPLIFETLRILGLNEKSFLPSFPDCEGDVPCHLFSFKKQGDFSILLIAEKCFASGEILVVRIETH